MKLKEVKNSKIKEIKITYADGVEKILSKGVLPIITPDPDSIDGVKVEFEMFNLKIDDVFYFTTAARQLGEDLFNKDEDYESAKWANTR